MASSGGNLVVNFVKEYSGVGWRKGPFAANTPSAGHNMYLL